MTPKVTLMTVTASPEYATPQPAPAEQPAAQPPKKRRTGLIIAAVVAVVVVAGGGATAYLATRGAATITATGTLTISQVTDKTCTGTYSGVGQGSQVTVTDPAGTIVGVGRLGTATASASQNTVPFGDQQVRVGDTLCEFPFQVSGIPAGKVSYGVSVANRPAVQVTEQDLRQGVRLAPAS